MGSTLGLYHFLLKNHHQAVVVSPNEFPDFLAWIPGSETVKIFEKTKKTAPKSSKKPKLFSHLISMLCTAWAKWKNVLNKLKVPFVMMITSISGWLCSCYLFGYGFWCPPAKCCITFISFLGKKSEHWQNHGTCIYTGILTDSGSFRFPKTTGTTHRIIADLIDLVLKIRKIPNAALWQ